MASVSVNAGNCSVTGGRGRFTNVAPFAARALKITTSTASSASTGPTVTVALTPSSGSVGSTWGGFVSRSGVTAQLVSGTNEYNSFGESSSDQVIFAVANITNESTLSLDYEVTCKLAEGDSGSDDSSDDTGGGDSGSGTSTFSLSTFSIEGESISPRYVWTGTALSIGWTKISVYVTESEITANSDAWASQNYLQFELSASNITGAGTYTVSGCYVESSQEATLLFNSDGSGTNYCSDSGTLTLTAFGTNEGDHITGSMTVAMDSIGVTPAVTGTIGATFDLVVGTSNGL